MNEFDYQEYAQYADKSEFLTYFEERGIWVLLLIVLFFVLLFFMFAFYQKVIKPFQDDRKYIKLQLSKAYDNDEYRFWKRELRRLYLIRVPFVGAILKRRHHRHHHHLPK